MRETIDQTAVQRPTHLCLFLMTAIIFGIAGCGEESTIPILEQRPVPVTVLKLQANRLRRPTRLTGSVMPWQKELLRFQIPGKLAQLRVVTPGQQVRGVLKDEHGEVLYKGDVIALLDSSPYRLAQEQAQAQLEMAQIKLQAARLSKEVAAETIKAAQARLTAAIAEKEELLVLNEKQIQSQKKLAQTVYDNVKKATEHKAADNITLAKAEADLATAEVEVTKMEVQKRLKEKELETYRADLSQALAQFKLQEAEERITEAAVKSAEADLRRSEQDIEKCTLRAPFDGVISEIFVTPGTLVDSSVPIASLVMMDPVRVDMSVSFKKLKDFHFGNEVRVYPAQRKGSYEKGYVYHIQTTADPSTRTFLAIIAVRNRQINLDPEFVDNQKFKDYEKIKNFSGVVNKNPGGGGPPYVDVRCIQRDEEGKTFVWKVAKKPDYYFNPEATIRKVKVELGDEYANVITWLFQELKEIGELTSDDILLIRPSLLQVENLKDPQRLAVKFKIADQVLKKGGQIVEEQDEQKVFQVLREVYRFRKTKDEIKVREILQRECKNLAQALEKYDEKGAQDRLKELRGLIAGLEKESNFISLSIYHKFSNYARRLLERYDTTLAMDETLKKVFVDELNQILQGDSLYDSELFENISVPDYILHLLKDVPQGENLMHLNRQIIECIYPEEIVRSYTELQPNEPVIQLRQDWLFHPGELVEVEYDQELYYGVYLPTEAILAENPDEEDYYVFVVSEEKGKKPQGQEDEEVKTEIPAKAKKRKISRSQTEDVWLVPEVQEGEKVVVHGLYRVNDRHRLGTEEVPITITKYENLRDLVKVYTIISTGK